VTWAQKGIGGRIISQLAEDRFDLVVTALLFHPEKPMLRVNPFGSSPS
jgi:hypothetical protein